MHMVVEQTWICSSQLTRGNKKVFIIFCTQDKEGYHSSHLWHSVDRMHKEL